MISIPNILTITRMLLTPLFVIFLVRGMVEFALVTFVLAGLSDALDGLIARYWNQRTALGAFLDPVADKILLMAAFTSVAILKMSPPWVSVVVVSRDVLILVGVGVLGIFNIPFEVRPSFISKCTTTLQIVTIFSVLLGRIALLPDHLLNYLFFAVSGFTILSGFQYIYIGMNLLQKANDG